MHSVLEKTNLHKTILDRLIVSTDTQEWKTLDDTDAYKQCWENKLQFSISFKITFRFHVIVTSG